MGRAFGIPIRVHWLLVVLLAVISLRASNPLLTLVWLGLLVLVVGLHELGHCLVARRFGATVLDITFWPLGGMARMSELPEDPNAEVSIALAGPGVNLVLALGALVALLAIVPLAGLEFGSLFANGLALAPGALGGAQPLVAWTIVVLATFLGFNVMLGLFNLVPAFPMDGGRVLRALLGRSRDWVTATEQAVRVSRWFALLMVIAAFFRPDFLLLPLIAIFVWIAGTRELWSVRLRHGRLPFGAPRERGIPGGSRSPRAPFGSGGANAFDELARAFSAATARARDAGGRQDPLAGPAAERAVQVDSLPKPGSSTRRATRGPSAHRPVSWTLEVPIEKRSHGFSDQDVERLERFRGRLPRSEP